MHAWIDGQGGYSNVRLPFGGFWFLRRLNEYRTET